MTKNSKFILNDPLIDEQHSALQDSLCALQALHDRHLSDEKVVDCLTRISHQLHQHFLSEEALMARVGVPADELAIHKNEHFRILEEMADLHYSIMRGHLSWVADVQHKISNWVSEHLRLFDAPIAPYINKANRD
ncbi:MAG: hemerythrin family protein [Rhodocyclaceae bacterium]|nr:hemerythrin family protein [Rhodocyclaceae bacterium]